MQNRGPRSVSTSPQVRARHRQAYLTGRAHRGSGTLRPNLRPSNEIYSEGARTPLPTSSKPWQCDLSSRFQGPRPSRPAPGGTTARPGARSQSCGDRGPPGPLHSIGPGSVPRQQGPAAIGGPTGAGGHKGALLGGTSLSGIGSAQRAVSPIRQSRASLFNWLRCPSHHVANTTLWGHDPPRPGPHPPTPANTQLDVRNTNPNHNTKFGAAAAALAHIHNSVRASGVPNYRGARIPLKSNLNIDVWRDNLADFHDKDLPEFLKYGFPVSFIRGSTLRSNDRNHASALKFPADIRAYLAKESELGAMAGPFSIPPFPTHTSPLMTRPKKSSIDRRVIVDLSFPPEGSVNAGTPLETFLGEHYKLTLPTIDNIVALIKVAGPGSFLYNRDLARAYRQLRSDPGDWDLLGITWEGNIYIDLAIPFGLRWGAAACQRTTTAVTHMHKKLGFKSLVYIDDFVGVEPNISCAKQAYDSLGLLMSKLGLEEAPHKAVPPTTSLTWIGIQFDTLQMEMRVPPLKLAEIKSLVAAWLNRSQATRPELQSLLGSLLHIAQCVKPARLFVARMLDTLRNAPTRGYIQLDHDFRLDLLWFKNFLPQYNGVHFLDLEPPRQVVEVDSCLSGCGAICDSEYYSKQFPGFIIQEKMPICYLECLNILVACRLWAKSWKNSNVLIFCDNAPTVWNFQSAKGRDPFILRCAREVFMISAIHNIDIQVRHKPGAELELADALSRAHLGQKFVEKVATLHNATPLSIDDSLFILGPIVC